MQGRASASPSYGKPPEEGSGGNPAVCSLEGEGHERSDVTEADSEGNAILPPNAVLYPQVRDKCRGWMSLCLIPPDGCVSRHIPPAGHKETILISKYRI